MYESLVHPKKKVANLGDKEKNRIYNAIKDIINSAIELKGSTKEIDLFGQPGKYIRIMDKESQDKECKRCGTKITKMNILGSASYFCQKCQKI